MMTSMLERQRAEFELGAAKERADCLEDINRRERNAPCVLLSNEIWRNDEAAHLIFEGLQDYYMECFLSGRLDVWASAAHAAVELLAGARVTYEERAA